MGKKCIILARVSTELQSLESQVEKLVDEAKRMGYDNNDITIIQGKESGVKLDIEERKTINELKRHIDTGQYNMVLIWEVSRLARRPKVLYEVREYLIENHVNLRCLTPSFTMLKEDGTIDPTASIVFALFGTMAEEEARLSKARMMRGRINKREQGKYIGGNVLFGYTWDETTDKIHIDESKRDTVVEFFERYVKNESIRSIAKDMLDRGLLPYSDYATACVMMRRMIRRSEYAGIKGDTYDYPSIISQELYNKVRKRAESKNKYKTRLSEIYYLQGLIHWKYNDMLMSPAKLSVMYKAWDERTNTGIMINMDYIDSLVWYFILEYKRRASGPERLKMIDSIMQNKIHILQRQRTAIEEFNKIEATIERINERVVKGKMSDEQGDRLIEEQQSLMKELDSVMNKCKEDMKYLDDELDNLKTNRTDDYSDITDEQKQSLFRQCIKKVVISNDNILKTGRMIYIYMNDDTRHVVHMTKRGNYFNTYYITKDNKEIEMNDLEITKRFVRKIY